MKTMTMASANGGEPILIEKILDSELGDKCGPYARVTISAASTTPSATSRLSSWRSL